MMKKTTLLFAICALVIGTSNSADAQKYQGESVVTLGAGYSFVGALFSNIQNSTTFSIPAIVVNYDYAIADNFTIGAAFSHQAMGYRFDYDYFNASNVYITEEVKSTFTRMNFGVRPLFHFGANDDIDMYTGLRIGYQTWSYNNDSSDPDFDDGGSILFNARPTVQPLFGVRYFFTQNIGFNTEIGLGSPYVAMAGLNFKF
jgi:hypothetical protein